MSYDPTAADLHAAVVSMHGASSQREVEDLLTLHAAGVAEGSSWEATRFCGWLAEALHGRDAQRAQRWLARLYAEVLR